MKWEQLEREVGGKEDRKGVYNALNIYLNKKEKENISRASLCLNQEFNTISWK